MAWILRVVLIIAAPLTALFVSRDALNFGVLETLVAIILIAGLAILAAMWPRRRPGAS